MEANLEFPKFALNTLNLSVTHSSLENDAKSLSVISRQLHPHPLTFLRQALAHPKREK